MSRIDVGCRVKLVGSRYFTNAIVPVVGVRRCGYSRDVIAVDVDCGREDGTPYAFPVSDVELVESGQHKCAEQKEKT